MQGDLEMFGVSRKKHVVTHLFEGDAEIFLKIEQHEYISAHRLMRAQHLRFCGYGKLESRFLISGVEKKNLKLKDVVDANVHYKVYSSPEHIYVPCMQA